MVSLVVVGIAAAVTTLALTFLVRTAALRRGVLAHPNARSSHAVATPTCGGIGFVIPALAALSLLADDIAVAWMLVASASLVAVVGLVDDLREVPAWLRLVLHLAAAGACLFVGYDLDIFLVLVLAFALAWFLNLYNFMDGIDGIAASQAAAFALGALALLVGGVSWAQPFLAVLAGCGVGFLVFNWHPAKIFMGDVGSGFLGLAIGIVVIDLWHGGALPLTASLILLVVFWFDATYVLCVRILTGQRFMDAHRSHLYQILSRRIGHGKTTGLFWALWLLWLLPLAWASVRFPAWAILWLVLSCIPMAVGCVMLGAGRATTPAQQDAG